MPLALMLLTLAQAADPSSAAWKERHFPDPPSLAECRFPRAAKQVRSLADLPEQVRMEVVRFFQASGGFADAGGEFNSTDVVDDRTVPRARLLRAYLTDDVWFIWWEAGGIGRTINTLALTRHRGANGSPSAFRATPGSMFSGDLCAGSIAFLAGARAVSDH